MHNKEYQAEWYKAHRETKLQQTYANDKKRYKTDPNFRLRKILRSRASSAIVKEHKSNSAIILVGCSIDYCRRWIEYQFQEEMSWDNHGSYWHIDHVKPCASYNLANEEEQKACFHWTNLCPMSAAENLSKRDKVDDDLILHRKHMVEEFLIEFPLEN